jgi:hypothetical protein
MRNMCTVLLLVSIHQNISTFSVMHTLRAPGLICWWGSVLLIVLVFCVLEHLGLFVGEVRVAHRIRFLCSGAPGFICWWGPYCSSY